MIHYIAVLRIVALKYRLYEFSYLRPTLPHQIKKIFHQFFTKYEIDNFLIYLYLLNKSKQRNNVCTCTFWDFFIKFTDCLNIQRATNWRRQRRLFPIEKKTIYVIIQSLMFKIYFNFSVFFTYSSIACLCFDVDIQDNSMIKNCIL